MGKTIVEHEETSYQRNLKNFQAIINPKPTGAEREELLRKIQQRSGRELTYSYHSKEDCCCKGEGHGQNKSCHCQCE